MRRVAGDVPGGAEDIQTRPEEADDIDLAMTHLAEAAGIFFPAAAKHVAAKDRAPSARGLTRGRHRFNVARFNVT